MARGNEILLSANPQGKFEEGIIVGTPAPGVCMEVVPGTSPVGGRFSFRPTTRAIGAKGPICILLPDQLQGKLSTDAYVTGTRGFLYWPVAGEEMNMQVEFPGTGGGNVTAIGQQFCVAGDNTGALTLVGSSVFNPFECREADVDLALPGNSLVWVQFLGAHG